MLPCAVAHLQLERKLLKFIYSEKATKLCKIFTLHLSYAVPVKSKVKILQNFVAFSEYMNFRTTCPCQIFEGMFWSISNHFCSYFWDDLSLLIFRCFWYFTFDSFQFFSISIQAQAPHKFCFAKSYFVGTQNILRKVHTFTSFQLCSQKTLWHVKSNRF